MFLGAILGSLALLSIALMLWQWWLGTTFPLHAPTPAPMDTSPVTILKPLKGSDSHTAECLQSWMTQSFDGPVQLLFGVADPADPVCAIVRALIEEHPSIDAELIVCPKRLGANAKVSTLAQLFRCAKHELIIVTDADVWAPPAVLDNLTAALADSRVGLVSCFYAEATPANVWMQLEAVAVNADFWTQVLQARRLSKMDFGLGAVMGTRRSTLARLGGFDALLDFLADDYQLGHRMAAAGSDVEVCGTVVECRSAVLNARDVWLHQLRWARTVRTCAPVHYFFSIVGNSTLWPLLYLIAAIVGVSTTSIGVAMPVFASALSLRILTALRLQELLTRSTAHYPWWFLPPIKDVLAAIVWAAAFIGHTVQWRGKRYKIARGGKLVEL